MAVSFRHRRALGKRYARDPAILLEIERLNREYALAPGREALGQQSEQFTASQAQQASQFSENVRLREEAIDEAAKAGMVGTAGNVLSTAAILRAMTKPEGEPFFGGLLGGETATGGAGYWGGELPQTGGMLTTGPAPAKSYVTTPALMDTTAAAGLGAGAGAGIGAAVPAVSSFDTTVPLDAFDVGGSFYGEGAGTGFETSMGAAPTTSGIGAGPALGGAAAIELARGNVGHYAEGQVGTSAKSASDIGSRAGQGALIGAYAGGPYGAPIGAAVGAGVGIAEETGVLENFFGGVAGGVSNVVEDISVICQELHRQGEITDRQLKWAAIFKIKHVSDMAYQGYLIWATPVVKLMRKNQAFNRLVKPIALALVTQWVNIAKGKKGSVFQRVVHKMAFGVSLTAYLFKKRGGVAWQA